MILLNTWAFDMKLHNSRPLRCDVIFWLSTKLKHYFMYSNYSSLKLYKNKPEGYLTVN